MHVSAASSDKSSRPSDTASGSGGVVGAGLWGVRDENDRIGDRFGKGPPTTRSEFSRATASG
ncbi:MAG TPA: hypothetical protein DCQ98_05835 [Planctomycetaceae bacterium]|nr:hypothetical protein [Planctomycetaceae bacterium]